MSYNYSERVVAKSVPQNQYSVVNSHDISIIQQMILICDVNKN